MQATKLFFNAPMYYQLAKRLSVSEGTSNEGTSKNAAQSQSVPHLFNRNSACLFYTVNLLGEAIGQGHSALFLPHYAAKRALSDFDTDYLFPELNDWLTYLAEQPCVMVLDKKLSRQEAVQCLLACEQPLVLIGQCLYLARHAYVEYSLSQRLNTFSTACSNTAETSALICPTLVGDNEQIDWQAVAVKNSLFSNFSIVVGGPGTGKTTTIAKMVEAIYQNFYAEPDVGSDQSDDEKNTHSLFNEPLKIAFAAPTGKAAARLFDALNQQLETRICDNLGTEAWQHLSQSMSESAVTLHRLLGWQAHNNHFAYNADHQLPFNCLVIDEVSMIDLSMFYYVLRAIPDDCRVILLGDPKQLASVQSGSVLSDICQLKTLDFYSSGRVKELGLAETFANDDNVPLIDNISFLRKSYRFNQDEGIGCLAQAILQGDDALALDTQKLNATDKGAIQYFSKKDFSAEQRFIKEVVKHAKSISACSSIEQAFEVLSVFQLLCVKREGDDSVSSINALLAEELTRGLQYGERKLRVHETWIYHGMPVMIQQNLYSHGLFNGDMGIVWFSEQDRTLYIYFKQESGELKRFLPMQLPGWQAAHAITVHKSQGSEYNKVGLWMPDARSPLLNRELFYTAVTRAKQSFICLSDEPAIKTAIAKGSDRFSRLADVLAME